MSTPFHCVENALCSKFFKSQFEPQGKLLLLPSHGTVLFLLKIKSYTSTCHRPCVSMGYTSTGSVKHQLKIFGEKILCMCVYFPLVKWSRMKLSAWHLHVRYHKSCSVWEDVYRSYANSASPSLRHLSIPRFSYMWGVLEPIPTDTKGYLGIVSSNLCYIYDYFEFSVTHAKSSCCFPP